MDYGIRFVYFVCILTQLLLLYMIFNVLGWSSWGLEHDHGVWVVGAPEVQQRKMITWAFKFLFLYVYYLPTLLMKLGHPSRPYSRLNDQEFLLPVAASIISPMISSLCSCSSLSNVSTAVLLTAVCPGRY